MTITSRQNQIITSALELINDKGIQGLTIKNLARKLNITEPAIYRHFANKIEILVELLHLLQSNTSSIFESEVNSGLSALQKVEQLFEKHFRLFSQNPSLAAVVFSEELFRNEEVLTVKIAEVIESNRQLLFAILKEGQEKNEIRNDILPEHLVIIILGTLRLFVKKWQFEGCKTNICEEGEKLIHSIKLLLAKQ
ncbi:MAG: TetR/AcrR family transcriptional regulator [Sphingobacteriia bacterium]|nr:TetR/AcrR family transcriptional regulator [Sphingobacteriia bacterium]